MEICSRFTGMERKNGAFLLHTDNANVKVCFVTDEIVRVRASFDHELAEESYVLMTTAWEDRIKLLPDAALYRSTLIHHTPDSYTKRELVGAGPSILLRKTVRSLKSPTGAFIAPLRCANASLPRGRRNRLTSPAKKNRAFPTGNALLYISLLSVAFGRVRPGGRALFFSWKTLRLLPILQSGCHSNRQSCGNLLKCSAVGYA